MLTVFLLATLPANSPAPQKAAPQEPAPAYFVKVDLIVVNRVRSHTTNYDAWGRPCTRCTEQWWVSFWEVKWSPKIPGLLSVPIDIIDRGWWTCSQCVGFFPCTEGWLVESKDRINVTAPDMVLIDSPYDWEMRNRRNYRPIKKP